MTKKAWREWFNEKVTVDENGCWILPYKPYAGGGYIRLRVPGSKDRNVAYQAHRLSYEAFVKKIPKGLAIDHLCRVRHCCNPKHLEPVTQRINTLRGIGPSAKNAKKTHCKRGHELNKENMRFSVKGLRVCKICKIEQQRLLLNQKPRTNVKVIKIKGKNYGLVELAENHGIRYTTLYNRLYTYNWSIEKALTAPTAENRYCKH